MSSPNKSTCLIDLSGTNESPTNTTSLMSFPPISTEEMIVPLSSRFSLSNDPFDSIETQAKLFGDPFEIVNITSSKETVTSAVPTATLLDFNGSGNSIIFSPPDSQNNSENSLNKAMCGVSSVGTDSLLVDVSSDTMNQAFVKSYSSDQTSSGFNRNRIASDPVTTKPLKKRKIGGKARCASLEQICLKNQFRKSMTNSPAGSPSKWSSKRNVAADGFDQMDSNSVDFNLTSESAFDDLQSTKPEWIESDNESDNDFERMTIPFLKNIQSNESTITSIGDCSSDRSSTIEKLSKFRKTESVAEAAESVDTSEDKLEKPVDDKPTDDKPVDQNPQVDNITSIIESLRNAVLHCNDAKKKSEASALLDTLNVCLKTTDAAATETNPAGPYQIVRQRTFSVDDQLDDTSKTSPNEAPKELSNSMPIECAQTRRSISGGVSGSVTPRRFSRSLTYSGKPVSVVSAIQSQPAADSTDRRRSSVAVCTTPTRLVRHSSYGGSPKPRGTRTSLGRQSLLAPQDEKVTAKPVQRKTVMKTSNPVPSSNAATRPLKLRVGEQTKTSGPLKAVIPYQRTTQSGGVEATAATKRSVKTSTPLAPNNISKSGVPAASSTPVLNNGKPAPATHSRQSQGRLSFTPSTPMSNSSNSILRQASTERKKRSVTFTEESDKLSQSMIVGSKNTSKQSVS